MEEVKAKISSVGNGSAEVDASMFFEALGIIIKGDYISTDELKPGMTGLFISFSSNILTMTATNAVILVENRLNVKGKGSFECSIDGKEIKDFYRKNSKIIGLININLSDKNKLMLYLNGKVNIFNIRQEMFPNYKPIIKQKKNRKMSFEKNEAISCLKMVKPFSSKSEVKMSWSVAKEIVFYTENVDFGMESKVSFPAKYLQGIDYSNKHIANFNINLLNKVLYSFPCEDVLLSFSRSFEPFFSTCDRIFDTIAVISPIFTTENDE